MGPAEYIKNQGKEFLKYMFEAPEEQVHEALGQIAISGFDEDKALEDVYLKSCWEQLYDSADFMLEQTTRLEKIGGASAEFAGRINTKEGYRDAELWVRAVEAQSAMAEKFDKPAEDFNLLVNINEEGQNQLVVLYTASEGMVPDSIFGLSIETEDRGEKYTIELEDGTKLDTRAGMTWSVYKDFISSEKQLGTSPLPDTTLMPTMLTGDPRDRGCLTLAQTTRRKSVPHRIPESHVNLKNISVRPSAVIGVIGELPVQLSRPIESDVYIAA